MSERETKEIVTPNGHKVVIRTYLTGREANELKALMYGAVKMSVEDAQSGKTTVGDVSGSFLVDQERKALTFLLVSIDGNAENAVDTLLDLPSTEYEAVINEINAIQNPTTPVK